MRCLRWLELGLWNTNIKYQIPHSELEVPLIVISYAFFGKHSPDLKVQLLVNGDPVPIGTNSVSNHSSTDLKKRFTGDNIQGLTMCEYIKFPSRCRVSVLAFGISKTEGFLCLRRI